MKELTKTQIDVLVALETFIKNHEYPPTVAMLGKILGKSKSSVLAHLKGLIEKGYVRHGYAERQDWEIVKT